jgi:hypothetical protein
MNASPIIKPRLAIEAAKAWCNAPTVENKRAAADAAYAAYAAAYAIRAIIPNPFTEA